MASISIVVTDNINGVVSNSYNFTDQEIKRISDTLKIVYKDQMETDESDREAVGENFLTRQLFYLLSRNLIQYILNTVHETETQILIHKAKTELNKIEVREL